MSQSLLGKTALITGGSGTIGHAIAKALLSQGASVILASRRLEKLQTAQSNLLAVYPNDCRVYVVPTDVSKEESVMQLFRTIDEQHGGLDILINSAGITTPGATMDLSADDFDRVMKVNVMGSFLCARESFKRMKERGGGRIINIGSLSAFSPRPHSLPYTTSKYALQGLSHSLALDGRPYNIAVSIIHPGNVRSELLSAEMIAEREQTEGFMDPMDVANCVLTMASLPYSTNVLELTVLPTRQPLVGRG